MKTVYPILLLMIFILSSCREIQPVIKPINNISKRKVLIEEMTGVGCVGCPAGSAILESLLELYPDNLVVVSVHEGNFARERSWHPEQRFDLRSEDGGDLVFNYFGGEAPGNPSAVIDRELSPTDIYYFSKGYWPGLIANELSEELLVELDLVRSYNESSRELSFEVEISPLSILEKDLRISAYITETDIIDYQKVPGNNAWDSVYVHKHVLRTIITDFDGEQVSQEDLTPGESILKNYIFELPAEWDDKNCSLVVFVHRNTADSREVLNAEEVKVVE